MPMPLSQEMRENIIYHKKNGVSSKEISKWLRVNKRSVERMDCLYSHKMKIISEMVESVDANVLYLPPYSPDFNPIETIFSQIKSDFRELKPRDIESICDVVTYAFYYITPEQAQNHFRNAFCNV